MRMLLAPRFTGRTGIVAYTALGYIALSLHHWLYAPVLADSSSVVHNALAFANLAAGTWCFLLALAAAFRGPARATKH